MLHVSKHKKMSLTKLLSKENPAYINNDIACNKDVIKSVKTADQGKYLFKGTLTIDDLIGLQTDDITELTFVHIQAINMERYMIAHWMGMYSKCRNLRKLHIYGFGIHTEFLSVLNDCPFLTELTIKYSSIGGDDLEILTLNPNLQRLDVSGNRRLVHLGFLKLMPNLTVLDISKTSVTNDTISAIKYASKLKVLNVSQTNISDDAIDNIAKLTDLGELDISDTFVSDFGYNKLQLMDKLTTILCDGSYVSPV